MLPHVGIDGRCLNTEHVRGMGRMLFSLLEEAANSGDCRFTVFGDRSDRPLHIPESGYCKGERFEYRGWRLHAWEQIGLPRAARRAGCDLLHSVGTWVPWWQPLPTVVTIHDVIAWKEGERSFHRDVLTPRAFHKCSALITISEASRADILSLWPTLANRLAVIPHGVSAEFLAADVPYPERVLGGRGKQFALYVGGDIPRKRLPWALEVWADAAPADSLFVACGIPREHRDRVIAGVQPALRSRVIVTTYLQDSELAGLYAHAAIVLYPSLAEGFGLPVLEAQATGTATMFSPVSALADLVGPAALPVPPHDMEQWRAALRRGWGNRTAAAASRAWAAQYSWARSWRSTLAVYQRALSRG